MGNDAQTGLSPAESRDLHRLAGLMIPADASYGVPGADDPRIVADIERTLGRDRADVCAALAILAAQGFADMPPAKQEAAAMALLARADRCVATLGRVVLQCYYRDPRVVRSLGKEPGAPFPRGNTLDQGDWSLLEAVRHRPQLWRDDRRA